MLYYRSIDHRCAPFPCHPVSLRRTTLSLLRRNLSHRLLLSYHTLHPYTSTRDEAHHHLPRSLRLLCHRWPPRLRHLSSWMRRNRLCLLRGCRRGLWHYSPSCGHSCCNGVQQRVWDLPGSLLGGRDCARLVSPSTRRTELRADLGSGPTELHKPQTTLGRLALGMKSCCTRADPLLLSYSPFASPLSLLPLASPSRRPRPPPRNARQLEASEEHSRRWKHSVLVV